MIDIIKSYKGLAKMPYPIYTGVVLKKELTPKKNNDRDTIWGNENTKKLN